MKIIISLLIFAFVVNCYGVSSDEDNQQKDLIDVILHKFLVITQQAGLVYLSIFATHLKAYVHKFEEIVVKYYPTPTEDGVAEFVDVHNAMLKEILSDVKRNVVENVRMTPTEFNQWVSSVKTLKNAASMFLLSLSDPILKPITTLGIVFIETLVVATVAFVEDLHTFRNPYAALQSLLLIIAGLYFE